MGSVVTYELLGNLDLQFFYDFVERSDKPINKFDVLFIRPSICFSVPLKPSIQALIRLKPEIRPEPRPTTSENRLLTKRKHAISILRRQIY